MGCAIGDTVVYHHGAAVIESREQRVHDGATMDYCPPDGLRRPDPDGAGRSARTSASDRWCRRSRSRRSRDLETKESKPPKNWSCRFKANYERLKSGDIFQIAEAVRNLAHYDADNGLSAGERRMYGTAKELLYGELSAAMNKSADDVADIVADRLLAHAAA